MFGFSEDDAAVLTSTLKKSLNVNGVKFDVNYSPKGELVIMSGPGKGRKGEKESLDALELLAYALQKGRLTEVTARNMRTGGRDRIDRIVISVGRIPRKKIAATFE